MGMRLSGRRTAILILKGGSSQSPSIRAHGPEQRGTNTRPDVELPARRRPDGMEEGEVRGR